MTKPTDEDILKTLHDRPNGQMTYVMRNCLSSRFKGLKVDWLRRQLQRLEKEGRVRRAPTHYARQICWALPDEA